MEELIIRRCNKCGAVIKYVCPCLCDDCGIMCCGEEMEVLKPQYEIDNVHVPLLVKKDKSLYVTMDHVMDEEHFISNIFILRNNEVIEYIFKPGEEIAFVFPYQSNIRVYALCNKHGLWEGRLK